MRGRVLAAVLALVAMVAVTTGCTTTPTSVDPVTVTGTLGTAPTLTFATPLTVASARVEVLAEGTGPQVGQGDVVLVNYFAESGVDASVIGDTYSAAPRAYVLTVDSVGQDIYDALAGHHVGARILQVLPAAQDAPQTVAVFDLLPTRAAGTVVEPRAGLPTVRLRADGEPTITMPVDGTPPTDITAQPLIRGDGPQVEAGQVVTVQYTGVSWAGGTVFDSTWAPGKLPAAFPIGVGSVPAGWDQGLVEQTVGSQVLLVLPPGSGYAGTDNELAGQTLVFVVDILAATGGPKEK